MKNKIIPLYERLSRDDDYAKSAGRGNHFIGMIYLYL